MSWTRLDDGYDEHAKLLALGRGNTGDARRWTWTRVLLYTNRNETAEVPWHIDEIIPKATSSFLTDCVNIGLLDDEDGRLVVHDWPLYADVPIADKVAYVLTQNPDATANEIVRACGGRRGIVLSEVTRQRGTEEPSEMVPDSTQVVPEVVPGNHQSGTRSGTHARAPDPTRTKDLETEGSQRDPKPGLTEARPPARTDPNGEGPGSRSHIQNQINDALRSAPSPAAKTSSPSSNKSATTSASPKPESPKPPEPSPPSTSKTPPNPSDAPPAKPHSDQQTDSPNTPTTATPAPSPSTSSKPKLAPPTDVEW